MNVVIILALLLCTFPGNAQEALITRGSPASPSAFRPFSAVGVSSRFGIGGAGFDLTTPFVRNFNVRAGSDFFGYSTTFQEQGARIAAQLRLRSSHVLVDWFPLQSSFRISPMVVFANNNRAQATAIIPAGQTITLNGENYISSMTDPLHGAASVDFRKVAPGVSFGFGNALPSGRKHFSFPIEAGFYYVGQPGLKVSFTGSACDPAEPPAVGCESVTQDSGFQKNLAAFIARNQHNLSYASYFPVFSVGVGYAFRSMR